MSSTRFIRGLAMIGIASVAISLAACASSGTSGADTSDGSSKSVASTGDETAPPVSNETSATDGAGANWSFQVTVVKPDGTSEEETYQPIDSSKITKSWRICVLQPHVKDPYWVAANYGTLLESQRDKLDFQMFEAGGYTELATQVNQMQDCITQGFDAIILAAISADGLCVPVQQALDKGITVIDFINGVTCPGIDENPKFAHAGSSFYDQGVSVAKFLLEHVTGPEKVGFFPGPEGANWVTDSVNGLTKTIQAEDKDIKIEALKYGDTGVDVQLNLITDALATYPDLTILVGPAVAAQAAVTAVRNAGKSGDIGIYSYAMIPPNYEDILSGDVVGAATDFTPVIGRIAIDEAVRMLEGESLSGITIGPKPEMITKDNSSTVEYTDVFAPKDFKATFSYEAK